MALCRVGDVVSSSTRPTTKTALQSALTSSLDMRGGRQFHSIESFSGESQDPLEILRDIQNRIRVEDRKYSPVLSAHHRASKSTLASRATVAKVGKFGRLYQNLPLIDWKKSTSQCPRRAVLEYLAEDCGVDREAVGRAVQVYEKVMQDGELTPRLTTFSRLHDVSAPIYNDIVRYLMLNDASEGMRAIIAIREDLRTWIRSLQATDKENIHIITYLKRFDEHLQEFLSVWFVPGLLEHRRITYETTAASVLERIVRQEAVHPVTSLKDLRRRLGPDRRVFAIFHPALGEEPLFVLYVALQPNIPSSMATIQHGRQDDSPTADQATPQTVACFYSISNLRPGLAGMGLGEYLLHETVEVLQQEIPSLETFATLSPIPNFRRWVEAATEEAQWITREDREALGEALSCPPETAVSTMLERLRNLDEQPLLTLLPNVQAVLLRWAAHFLYNEKHRRKPLDQVARFHLGNGAILDQLHWGADLSRKGWQSSFGIMVTYRYDLGHLSLNQSRFESNDFIAVGESFTRHIPRVE